MKPPTEDQASGPGNPWEVAELTSASIFAQASYHNTPQSVRMNPGDTEDEGVVGTLLFFWEETSILFGSQVKEVN